MLTIKMTKKQFIKVIKNELKQHGFKLIAGRGQTIRLCGEPCGGYFDYESKEIRFASKHKTWFEILIHEYAHFIQHINQTRAWKHHMKYENYDLFAWLRGEIELSDNLLKKIINAFQKMELECEKITVSLIKDYKLPVNINNYIKDANSYILFYAYMRKHKTWYKTAPYTTKIVNIMPSTWLKDYSKMPPLYEELTKKYCAKK